MKKFIFFFTAMFLLSGFMLRGQEIITIGTGTSNWYDPVPGWFGWNYDVMMYAGDEIGMSGTITHIAYNFQQAGSFSGTKAMSIYMMTTTSPVLNATVIPNFNTIVAQADLVKTLTPAELVFTTGWITFALDVPFFYDESENLLIIVEGRGCTNSGGCAAQVYCHTTLTNRHWHHRTDTPTPTGNEAGTFTASYRANIRLTIDEANTDCPRISDLAASNVTARNATITWTPGDEETQWLLAYRRTSEATWSSWIEVNEPSYSFDATPLSPNTPYVVRVRAFCAEGDTSLHRETGFTTLISCPAPTNIGVVGTIATTQVTLNWRNPATPPEIAFLEYVVEYKMNSVSNWTVQNIPDTFITLTGLNPSTFYDVRIRAACAGDEHSTWLTSTFRTACGSITTFPWLENFDNYGADAFPSCMFRPVVYENYPRTVSAHSASPPFSLRFQSNLQTIAITPRFERDVTELMVTFKLRREGDQSGTFQVGVVTNPADMNSFTPVQTFSPSNATWHEFDVMLNTAGITGAHYIGFKQNATHNNWYYWLDDVVVEVIPSCPRPAVVTVVPAGLSAVASWDPVFEEDQWLISYKLASASTWSEEVLVLEPTYTIGSLAGVTAYNVRVRALCGVGDTSNYRQANFTTLISCRPPTNLAVVAGTLSYFSASVNWRPNTQPSDNPGPYEVQYRLSTETDWTSLPSYINDTVAEISGLLSNRTYNVRVRQVCTEDTDLSTWTSTINITTLITCRPPTNLAAVSGTVSYFSASVNWRPNTQPSFNPGPYEVQYRLSTETDWTSLPSYINDTVAEISGLLSNRTYNIRVRQVCDEEDQSTWTSTLNITTLISCPAPTNFAVITSSIEENEATLNWRNPTAASYGALLGYLVEYKPHDVGWSAAMVESVTDTFITLTGLSHSTLYNVRVRTSCEYDDNSSWVTVNFRTACGIITELPWRENFDSYTANTASSFPPCMFRPVIYNNFPQIVTAQHASSPNSLRFTSNMRTLAITPEFSQDVTELMVSFRLRREGASSGVFQVGVVTDPTDTSTFTPVRTFDPTSGVWHELDVVLNAADVAGAHYIGFKQIATANNWHYWLDDIIVDEAPLCTRPAAVSVTALGNRAAVSWEPTGEETEWLVSYKTASDSVWSDEVLVAGDPACIVRPLTENTSYNVRVRAFCGEGDTSSYRMVTFNSGLLPNCDPVTDLTAQLVGDDMVLSWTAPEGTPENYEIFFNGVALDTITTTSYTHSGVPDGFHNYTVTAIFDGDCRPIPVNIEIAVRMTCEDEILDEGNVLLYTIPLNTYFDRSYTQQIFDASEIGGHAHAWIKSISFQYIHTTAQAPVNQTIYLGNTNKTVFGTTTDWVPVSQMQEVYRGTVTYNNSNAWVTITFNEPFEYTGENLVVAYLNNRGTYTTSTNNTFRAHNAGSNKTLRYAVDGTTVLNPSSVTYTGTLLSDRNNVKFNVCTPQAECPRPVNLTVGNILGISAVASWETEGTETQWLISYKTASASIWTEEELVSELSYTMEPLIELTSYDVRVRTYCGEGDTSAYRATTFRTGLIPATIPFTEDFEEPTTWQLINGTQPNRWVIDSSPTANNNGGMRCLYISNDNLTPPTYNYNISSSSNVYAVKDLLFDEIGEYTINYDWKALAEACCDYIQVWLAPFSATVTAGSDPNTTGWINLYGANLNMQSSWQTRTTTFFITQTGVYKLIIRWRNDSSVGDQPPGAVDNIEIYKNTCPRLVAITVQDITVDACTVSWISVGEETQWLLSYKESSEINWSAEILVIDVSEYFLTGLNENSLYDVRVRALCAEEDTSLFVVTSFRTACENITEFPWVENFDNYGVDAFPPCMFRPVIYENYPRTVSAQSVSSPYSLRFQSNLQTIAVTPRFERKVTDLMVTFKLRREGSSSGTFQVGIVTDPRDMNSFIPIQTFDPSSGVWHEFNVELNISGLPEAHYIGFKQIATGSNWYYWLDDVVVNVLPEIDMAAISIVGPTQPGIMRPYTYDVTVKNRGISEDLSGFTVKVMTENDIEIGILEVTEPLEPGATRVISVPDVMFTADMIGTLRIKGRVEMDGDMVEFNNETPLITIAVQPDIDMAAISVTGLGNPSALRPYTYNVTVRNNGFIEDPVSGYTVKLMTTGDELLGEVLVTEPLAQSATAIVSFPNIVFDTAGIVRIKGVVEIAGDQVLSNNETAPFTVNVRPFSEDDFVNIPQNPWSGSTSTSMPFIWNWNSSMVQSVYLASEIGVPDDCLIRSLTWFYNNTSSVVYTRPVKVYLATTNQTSLPAWLPLSNFTLVYEGTVTNPLGQYELTVELAEPFLYTGGNLVVMTERPMMGPWQGSISAYTTTVTPTARTRTYSSDGTPFDWTQAGTSNNAISNIRMSVITGPFGTLRGTVTSGGSPVADATVTISSLNFTATTDASGAYEFPLVPARDYTVVASKFGYFDDFVNTVIVANTENIVDFELTLRPQHLVSGIVEAAEGYRISGASITLSGYENYDNILTNASGEFSISNVYEAGGYLLTVTAEGYTPYVDTVDVSGITDLGTIILYDVPVAPSIVEAEIVNEHVEIIWGMARSSGRGIVGYKLWRLRAGQESNENIWSVLIGEPENTQEFTDAQWNTLVAGSYRWAVKAVYHGGIESDPTFSNTLERITSGTYVVTITTNSGDSPSGAEVRLTHATYPPHTGTSGATGVVSLPNVTFGTYRLDVTLSGFHAYTSNVNITLTSLTHNVELIEILEDPYQLRLVQPDCTMAALFSWNNEPPFVPFHDDMESYENFIIQDIGDYTLLDLEGSATRIRSDVTWPNAGLPQSFIVMNPSATTPAATAAGWSAHSGSKYLACFNKDIGNPFYGGTNNDWLILPQLRIADGVVFRFWAKSFSDQYELERFKVGVSTTGTNPSDFTFISSGSYVVPPTTWTEYSYNLSSYAGQDVYLAINCVSHDSWFLMIDDISVDIPGKGGSRQLLSYTVFLDGNIHTTGVQDTEFLFTDSNTPIGVYSSVGVQAHYTTGSSNIVTLDQAFEICNSIGSYDVGYDIYPNPATRVLTVDRSTSVPAIIELYNAMGMLIGRYETGEMKFEINVASLSSGTYFIRVIEGDHAGVRSFVKK